MSMYRLRHGVIRFGTVCLDDIDAQTITRKDSPSLSVVRINGVTSNAPTLSLAELDDMRTGS